MFDILQKVMPEQQRIDETIETSKNLNRKKLSKIEQSSTSLENQQYSASETGLEENVPSPLETQNDEVKS